MFYNNFFLFSIPIFSKSVPGLHSLIHTTSIKDTWHILYMMSHCFTSIVKPIWERHDERGKQLKVDQSDCRVEILSWISCSFDDHIVYHSYRKVQASNLLSCLNLARKHKLPRKFENIWKSFPWNPNFHSGNQTQATVGWKLNHHFSPSQLSPSVVVDLSGGKVEMEEGMDLGGRLFTFEGGRLCTFEGTRGEIVPDSEMEFTSGWGWGKVCWLLSEWLCPI